MRKTSRSGRTRPPHPLAPFFFLVLLMLPGCGNDYEDVHGASEGTSEETGLSAPVLKSPADGEEISVINPELVWESVDVAVSFRVELSLREDFETLEEEVEDIPATSYMISDFTMQEGTHFWRVRARSSSGDWSPWSDVSSFIVVTRDAAR